MNLASALRGGLGGYAFADDSIDRCSASGGNWQWVLMYVRGGSHQRSIVERLVEELSNEIRMGVLKPGEKLPSERQLCERFGIGRSSVREALRILGSQGMIEVQMGRGSFVTDFTAPSTESPIVFWNHNHETSFTSLLEVRLAIEPQVAALAAHRATEDHLEQLHSTLEQLREHIAADNFSGRIFADIAFHDCLFRASDNELYLSIYRGIEPMLFDIRRIGLRSGNRSTKVLDRHENIYQAVKSRDSDTASEAMWVHLLEFAVDMGISFDADKAGLVPRHTVMNGKRIKSDTT